MDFFDFVDGSMVLRIKFSNYSAYQNQSIDADLAEMDASSYNMVKKEKRYH